MTYYTIYKITNKINGKIYIGSHKTENLKDKYMGSGKYLNHSINKHGVENFEKEILFVFDTPEEMYAKEAELVNVDFIAEENTYNLKVGGFGGWDYINSGELNGGKIHKAGNLTYELRAKGGYARAERCRDEPELLEKSKRIARQNLVNSGLIGHFAGKKHSTETKEKISNVKKGKCTGKQNSQYGTCWIHNLELQQSKKIKKDDLQIYLNDNWIQGRKMKF